MITVNRGITRDLVTVDEAYDRENASDGVSRYGAYLRSRAHLFDDGDAPLGTVAFTVLAWQIATGPVMSPGYVRVRTDIHNVSCRHSEEPGVLVADLEVRLRWPAGLYRSAPLAGWRTWEQPYRWEDEPPCYVDPVDDKPALLLTAHLWLPIPEAALATPRRHTAPGKVDVSDAKRAVRAICRHVNAAAGPVVASVQESCGGRR